jgi:limonene-1,2-epoxide hydrolase
MTGLAFGDERLVAARIVAAPIRFPSTRDTVCDVADSLDLDAFVQRFRERAKAVKNRPLPPVEGAERARFKERAQQDFLDFALIGDATASFDDGVITLRIDLRPPGDSGS